MNNSSSIAGQVIEGSRFEVAGHVGAFSAVAASYGGLVHIPISRVANDMHRHGPFRPSASCRV